MKGLTTKLWLPFCITLALLLAGVLRPLQAATYNISYHLPRAGKVSINVYDSTGGVARELLHTTPQSAGDHVVVWDGLRTDGSTAPPGHYSWKLLSTPGFMAHYEMSLGSNYPIKTDQLINTGGPGNHCTPNAIAIDKDGGLYVGAVQNEGVTVPSVAKVNTGDNTRAWSIPSADPGAVAVSVRNLVVDNDAHEVFRLTAQSESYLQQIIVANSNTGADLRKFPVDWNGESTRGDNTTGGNDIRHLGATDMDISLGDGKKVLAVAYHNHDAIRWYDAASGAKLDEAVGVKAPEGIACGPEGTLYVSTGNQVVSLSSSNHNPQPVITANLTHADRLAYDPADGGSLFVWDVGTQQVKRFSVAAGKVGSLLKTYGAPGGRVVGDESHSGIYVPTNFLSVTDICGDGKGGFYVSETWSPPRRVAHFDSEGRLLHEWIGPQGMYENAQPDPTDPNVVWTTSNIGDFNGTARFMLRLIVDYDTKTWKLHSCYKYMAPQPHPMNDPSTQSGNAGFAVYAPRGAKPAGTKYFVVPRGPNIFKIDEKNWRLIPLLINHDTYLWKDANGNGLDDGGAEHIPYSGNVKWPPLNDDFIDGNLDYYYAHAYTTAVNRVPVTGYEAATGTPIYGNLPNGVLVASPPNRLYIQQPNYVPSIYVFHDTTVGTPSSGNIYGALNPGTGWFSESRDSFMQAWDNSGKPLWSVGRLDPAGFYDMNVVGGHKPQGKGAVIYDFHCIAGTTHGCIVASGYDGGWWGYPMPTYVWDQDGLWAGGLMDSIDPSTSPLMYQASGEPTYNRIVTRADGSVYLFGDWTNEVRVFKITGWDGWYRASGQLSVAKPSTPSIGQGLAAEYFDNPDFSDLKTARVDNSINFNWGKAAPKDTKVTNARSYSVRWQGTVTPDYGPQYSEPTWYINGSPECMGGAFRRINRADGTFRFAWSNAKTMAFVGHKGPDGGLANIYVNDVLRKDIPPIDFYSPTETAPEVLFSVANLNPQIGNAITVEATGAHDAASSGSTVYLDKFVVNGEDIVRRTKLLPTVNFKFKGTSVSVFGRKEPPGGLANVAIDGVLQEQIDCYSPTSMWTTLFSKTGLSNDDHVLTIQNLGRHNVHDPATDNNFLEIDKYTVDGVDIDDSGVPYTFSTDSDAATQLFANGKMVLSDWYVKNNASRKASAPVILQRGQKTPLQLNITRGKGEGQTTLLWSNPFSPEPKPIPSSALYPLLDDAFQPVQTGDGEAGCIYNGTDTVTQGDWRNADDTARTYGQQGYLLAQGGGHILNKIPESVCVIKTSELRDAELNYDGDPRLPLDSGSDNRRSGHAWSYPGGVMTLDLNFVDGNWHRLSVYGVQPGGTNWTNQYKISDAANGKLLDAQSTAPLTSGSYVSWNLRGHVKLEISGYSCVNGFFVDAPQGAVQVVKDHWLNVDGKEQTIADGASTPTGDDGTDFGAVKRGTTASRVFTLKNSGVNAIRISRVSAGGDFTIAVPPPGVLAPGATAKLTVRFKPATAGQHRARISIINDSGDSPYDFVVQGVGK